MSLQDEAGGRLGGISKGFNDEPSKRQGSRAGKRIPIVEKLGGGGGALAGGGGFGGGWLGGGGGERGGGEGGVTY